MGCRLHKVPRRYLLPFLCACLFVIELGIAMINLPSLQLMQDIICKYQTGTIADELLPEEDCHDESVQHELNLIQVGTLVSITIGGALVSFPLGLLADRLGRTVILQMGLVSMILSQIYSSAVLWFWTVVPLRALWAVGAMVLLGGGQNTVEAMAWTLISDVTSGSQRACWFQYVVAAVLIGQAIGSLLSIRLVVSSVWTTVLISIGSMVVGSLPLMLFVPETLCRKEEKESAVGGQTSKVPAWVSVRRVLKLSFTVPASLLLPGAVLVMPVASVESELVTRLMPLQFGWPLSRAVLLISVRSLITLVVLLLILPFITDLLCKHTSFTAFRRDRTLARGSVIFVILGSLGLTLVADEVTVILGMAISALGSGLPAMCKAMLVQAVGEENSGSMFGMLAMGEIMAFLVCELCMGALFSIGLRSWLGLPFCLGWMFMVGTGLATWLVPLSRDVPSL